MVYIHGGGWFSGTGTSDQIGPSYIMDHQVVLVTFNYRLGVFGMLNYFSIIFKTNDCQF